MKRFIKKTIIAFFLYILFCRILALLLPYHYGNPWYSAKIQFLEKNLNTPVNTFFFGSSLVYRQISPSVFDSICSSGGINNIKSFNLGAPATFCPETYYLYENFLNSDLSQYTEYCFIELRNINNISDDLMHQERTTYWLNFSGLVFVTKSFIHNDNISMSRKVIQISRYILSYIENMLHIGHFNMQITTRNYYRDDYIGVHQNGFYPLESQIELTNDPIVKGDLINRKNTLANNPSLLAERKEHAAKAYNYKSSSYDSVNYNRIINLIRLSAKKGIHLIFILSPRLVSKDLIELSKHIPARHIIDLANPDRYPEFYELENSFDKGHFNNQGIKIYSEILAEEFLKITE